MTAAAALFFDLVETLRYLVLFAHSFFVGNLQA